MRGLLRLRRLFLLWAIAGLVWVAFMAVGFLVNPPDALRAQATQRKEAPPDSVTVQPEPGARR